MKKHIIINRKINRMNSHTQMSRQTPEICSLRFGTIDIHERQSEILFSG